MQQFSRQAFYSFDLQQALSAPINVYPPEFNDARFGGAGLLAKDIESAVELSVPQLSQAHVLLAIDIESGVELSLPSISQVHNLLSVDIESLSEISASSIYQKHILQAVDIESSVNLSKPAHVDIEQAVAEVLLLSAKVEVSIMLGEMHVDFVSTEYSADYPLSKISVDLEGTGIDVSDEMMVALFSRQPFYSFDLQQTMTAPLNIALPELNTERFN